MRKVNIAPGEFYHIYNRGTNKQPIFLNESDCARFLFCLLYFQSDLTFNNLGFYTSYFRKHGMFNVSPEKSSRIISKKNVELINFSLMPNHFHITVFEKEEKGIAKYMQRVLNSYTKYFNTKYKRSGHLFQGPYQAVHLESNKQLTYLSTYIHKHFSKAHVIKGGWQNYFWSSYRDYTKKNRWSDFLRPEIILDQFKNKTEYEDFVKTSTAKESKTSGHSVSTTG